jgi:hypothetical protein
MFAIIIAGPTSGGHFNPAVTVALTVWYVPASSPETVSRLTEFV